MSSLTLFDFESSSVRVLMIDGDPWFVAKDVLSAIRSTTTVTALESLLREELGEEFVTNQPLLTSGGKQKMLVLSEAAVTMTIARSRTEWGKRMNRWIHAEVLPSIRKTGLYSSSQSKPAISYYTDRVIHMRKHLVCPKGYWAVVQKSAHLLSTGCRILQMIEW